jgi:hypothetical protein
MKNIGYTIALLTCLLFSVVATAQMCNNYHTEKKACPPSTDNFIINGQSRSAMMYKGQKSKLNVIFHDSQDYRISICPQAILGDQVSFKIMDGKSLEVLYDNNDADGTLIFEFSCEQTQRLVLEVEVPDDGEAGGGKLTKLKSSASGCLGILIEYMATPKTGF